VSLPSMQLLGVTPVAPAVPLLPTPGFNLTEDGVKIPTAVEVDKSSKAQLDELYSNLAPQGINVTNWDGMKINDKKLSLKKALGYAVKAVATLGIDGDIMTTDTLNKTVYEVENIDSAQIDAHIDQLQDDAELNTFRLGGVLAVAYQRGFFGEFTSFKDWVRDRHGIELRSALYHIQIYRRLVETGVTWDQVKAIGWTKLKDIIPIITKENVVSWVDKIVDSKLTSKQIVELVKFEKAKGAPIGSPPSQIPDEVKTVSVIQVKTLNDQKETILNALKTFKEKTGTLSDGHAMEMICLEYLNSSALQAAPSSDGSVQLIAQPIIELTPEMLEAALAQAGPHWIFGAIERLWPDITITADLPADFQLGIL